MTIRKKEEGLWPKGSYAYVKADLLMALVDDESWDEVIYTVMEDVTGDTCKINGMEVRNDD
jgi:hypothetical protein